ITLVRDAAQVSVNRTSLTFTPQNWNAAQSVQVTAVDDAIDEADVHLSLITHTTASADPNYNQATARFTPLPTVTVRITDNDTAGVDITPTALTVAEGGASASYSVRLESEPTAPVTITLGRDAAQVSVNRSSLTFTPQNWNVAQSVQVTAVDDAIDEADVHLSLITHTTASADPNYNQPTARFTPLPTVTVRITDNDTAGVDITPTALTVAEGGASASYSVRLESEPTAPVTITLVRDAAQVSVNRSSLTFTPGNWNVAQSVQVTAVDDAIDEADVHTSLITHTTASADPNYNQATAPFRPLPTVTVRITDNDTAGVAIMPTTVDVAEGGASANYTVRLLSEPTAPVTISLGRDAAQVSVNRTSLVFTPQNWNTAQSVQVTAVDDAIDEADVHTSQITHTTASRDPNYNQATAPFRPLPTVTVRITDNDTAGVTITPTTLTVEEGRSATYTVELTSQPTTPVTVNLTVPGGVTTSASSLEFTAANWTDPQTVTVTATENAIAEGDRSVTIRHAVASTAFGYAGLAVDPVAVTITDNDTAGVAITPTALTVEEGRSATYTVELTSQPTTPVTVNLTVPAGVTTSASSLTFTGTNWTAPQTVTVTATENAIAEGDRSVTITHAVTSTAFGYAGLAVAPVAVTITDNDTAGFILSESAVTLAEGAVFTYTVELTSQPTATVTLNLNEPATLAVTPTILSFTDRDWATPQTVTVTALDDDIAPGERTLTITHTITTSDPVYAALNAPVVEVTVSDDDTAGLTVLPPTLALSEDVTANTGVFSLTLETQPLADVTITLTPDGQVGVVPTTLLFTVDGWDVPQNVTVTAVDDAIVEPSPHTGVITITSISTDASYNRTWPDYTVSITDNDVAGIEVVAPSGQFTSEDGDFVTMTLRLTSQPTASVSIDVISSDVSEGVVSAASGLPLVFDAANWAVPQIVTITGVDDDLFDGLQAYTIEVRPAVSADPNYAGLQPDPASFVLSNTDNERTRVSIGDAGAAVENTLRYPLTLTRPISDAIDLGLEIILINTLDGTSSLFATATHIIVADAITSTINLEVVRPQFAQPGILVAVRLTSITTPSAQAVLGNSQGLGWVLPDPVTTPTVRFAQAEALVTIGNTGTATVRLEVVLDTLPTDTVAVQYAIVTGGTADAADYTFTPGWLTFNTGQISQTIDVIINGRPSSQLYKTLRIGLTNPTNATLGDPNIATITIVYNEITWPNDVTGYVGYMFTAGPDIPAERGYYYINNVTLANGREGFSYAFIGVPCSWDQTRPLSIQLFSPGLHSSPNTLDTILNSASTAVSSNLSDAGNTFFELYGPGTELGPAVNMPGPGADGSLDQQIFAPTASAEQWQTVWTIPAPVACGRYILRSATEGNDMNNWAVRVGWDHDANESTAPLVGTDTGEIITLGMFQTTVKNYVTRYATRYANDEFCLTKWFYVPPATASLTLQQYDLDRHVDIRLRVRFYRPSDPFDPRALQGGLAPANPVFGEALWERDTFTNPEGGWWRSVVCTPYQDNAYVLDAIADEVKLPLTVNPPPPAPDLLTSVTGASLTAEVTPTVALTLTYQNRAPLATALRPTLIVNLPPQLTFPADVCTQIQIADPSCRLENGALIIQPARVAPGAQGTYQVPAVVTPGSQGTALIQLETRFQDVMGNRYRNGSVAILTLP
ncbi:Calx-beta domain-containing protein, partial [Candidatus Chloroploca asiatica]|uniref:Calx-beta domain-containing protein n=1 Tax=Candidatus Chloroploca asiatica TaxID=1506545 RepID=UPI0024823725